MSSIRLYLTLTLTALITLVNFLASLRGYQESMVEAETLFDEQLLEYALLIDNLLPAANGRDLPLPVIPDPMLDNQPDFQSILVFQVFDTHGHSLMSFNTRATAPVTPARNGYSEVNFDGYRWRAFTYSDPIHGHLVITAQRIDIRFALAERVILESVLPIIFSIPVVGLLVWWLVGSGLRPVNRLAGILQHKEVADLSPVTLEQAPRELMPLQESTNALLSRLKASFEREKRLAADAAHELRTPISVLKVQIHNLLADLSDPPPAAQELKVGIDRMGHLVEQILDLYRSAPDLYMANFETLDLYGLCQEAIRDSYPLFAAKHQTVDLDGSPIRLTGDRFALSILMKNLLSNAAKYTQADGSITVTVAEENGVPCLTVTDNGPGIPPADRARVLERFYRVGGDRHASEVPGCGLGLAIVNHIVELHRGSLTLDAPRVGTGLVVTIRFPPAAVTS